MIKVIAIGKKHESWVAEGIERYQKRLKPPFDIEWVLLPHSTLNGTQARENESQAIMAKLSQSDYVIFTSANAVNSVAAQVTAKTPLNAFCISGKTRKAVEQHFAGSRIIADAATGATGNAGPDWLSVDGCTRNPVEAWPLRGFLLHHKSC